MRGPCFTSIFADSLKNFVAFKRSCGCVFKQGAYDLACFDRFASEHRIDEPLIRVDLAGDYRASMPQVTRKTCYNRMCVLRAFSAFHHLREPRSEVLYELGVRKLERIRFIILSADEVAELMRATGTLAGLVCGTHSVACVIGLLYCCGLRINEALSLTVADFDPEHGTLFIRCGKFGKQRTIPLAPSSRTAVAKYLSSRRLPSRIDADTALFVDQKNRPLTYACFYPAFKRLVRSTGLDQRRGPVRPHDLRHSFATTALRRTLEEGGDVYAMLPRLATFMGHVSYSSTQIYLHTDPACLAHAAERFHHAFRNTITTHRQRNSA